MIKKILVLSRPDMETLIANDCISLSCIGKWNLISIHGSHEPLLNPELIKKLKGVGMQSCLSFNFWDITESDVEELTKQGQDYVLFNTGHSNQIIEMFNTIKNSNEDSTLIIHCHAGISRSGAVGIFATDFFDYDFWTFRRDNPNVSPNYMILRMLRNDAGLNLGSCMATSTEEAYTSSDLIPATVRKCGVGTKPTTAPPPPPKGQGKHS